MMVIPDSLTLPEPLSVVTFERLRGVWEQMVFRLGDRATLLTEAAFQAELGIPNLGQSLTSYQNLESGTADCFNVLVSQSFNALLLGQRVVIPSSDPKQEIGYRVKLTFEPEAIASFLQQLASDLPVDSTLHQSLQPIQTIPQPNDAALQSEFTLQLIATLSPISLLHSTHQTCEIVLHQQIEQERLLNRVVTQIHQSLELPVILQTAVEQVRHYLGVDRLVIYQLSGLRECPVPLGETNEPWIATAEPTHNVGFIIHEARSSESIPSVLYLGEDLCFTQTPLYRNKYLQGFILAVDNINTQYSSSACLLQFLQQTQVQAKLVAPILVYRELWGFLIAHNCHAPHQWQESEKKLLKQIGEHLAIAISQAELYGEVQRQKQTLEKRVIERTQELHDAMLAAQLANRAKSEFLAAVSHELRTPLTCIIGMSATLQRWFRGKLDERQHHFLELIHNSGETLLGTINNILDVSQLEAGKAILNLSEFSLSLLTQQILKVFQEKAMQSGVDLELDLQVDAKYDRFIADPHRVQQILSNLLSNAIKFTPRGGKVTLRLFAEETTATFQVKDTGIGIPDQQRVLLFQKFQQLDGSYQREYEGTGLGLALTKQLVELHEGSIVVQSSVGVGSVFTVRLPRRQVSTSSLIAQTEPSATAPQTLGRIVLIESHEESANIICDVLTAAGYQVIWMTEGLLAIAQVEVLQPLMVIADTHLADSDGYEAIRYLRQNPATKALTIIAIISTEIEEQEQCIAAGANDYISKPISPTQILDKINGLTPRR
jgi:two-component system sensor histidine kinase/response regulator